MVTKMNQAQFDELNKEGLVLIDFNATWCGPCKMLAPVLEEVSKNYEGKVTFVSVDTDENPDLAEKYNIISIPALVLLENGEKKDMNVGFAGADALANFIDKNL